MVSTVVSSLARIILTLSRGLLLTLNIIFFYYSNQILTSALLHFSKKILHINKLDN